MAVTMHVKSDSEVTSIDASSPPRSPRRPLYYVQSPSQNDVEKMSYGSSPLASPTPNYHYHCSPIQHSRESSTSRFSASLKNPNSRHLATWKRIQPRHDGDEGEDDDDSDGENNEKHLRFYVLCFVLSFVVLFTIFSLILWAASVPYKPKIFVKNTVFETFNIQAGMDGTGVQTDMLTLNSTVKIFFRNPATFFGVHVTATPLELHYYQLKVASGHVKKFYQSRKSQRMVVAVVLGNQVPLYGGVPFLNGAKDHLGSVSVPLNLTFVMRSRAYVLGRLVKPKFYRRIRCGFTFKINRLGKPLNLTKSCIYE
ncbi:NDR1/HIN1-like protein 1 [Cornus florida]|uniref:NDR1/HIN1-like protein 1 n=1 Tax=Cornus florida TaxID=4283 RepID=UPI0028A030C0|nr:NDR1/HIN1-like protein 1 [Cornus florida]